MRGTLFPSFFLIAILSGCSESKPKPLLPSGVKVGMTFDELGKIRPGTYVGSFALRALPKFRRDMEHHNFSGVLIILDYPAYDEQNIITFKQGNLTNFINYAAFSAAPVQDIRQSTFSNLLRTKKTIKEILHLLPNDVDLRQGYDEINVFSVDLPANDIKYDHFSGTLGNLENFGTYNRELNLWFYDGKIVYVQSVVEKSKLSD